MKSISPAIGGTPDDEAQQLPPRSHLYCLAALAHCVSTWTLLKCEIAPRLFGPGAKLRNRLSELLAAMGSAFNGENDTSKTFIAILSSLTGRDDLSQTTMGFCHGFVGSRFWFG
jgi:hypothetical protein